MNEKLKNCPYCTSPREPWEVKEDTGVKIIDCLDRKFYLQMYSPEIRIELPINHCPNCGKLLQHNSRADKTHRPNNYMKNLLDKYGRGIEGMNTKLYSELANAFSDTYCENGKVGVAKLYAEIMLRADKLLETYLEEESDDEEN